MTVPLYARFFPSPTHLLHMIYSSYNEFQLNNTVRLYNIQCIDYIPPYTSIKYCESKQFFFVPTLYYYY